MSIKDRFIENVLRDEGNRLLRNQGKALRKRLKFHTQDRKSTRLNSSHREKSRMPSSA